MSTNSQNTPSSISLLQDGCTLINSRLGDGVYYQKLQENSDIILDEFSPESEYERPKVETFLKALDIPKNTITTVCYGFESQAKKGLSKSQAKKKLFTFKAKKELLEPNTIQDFTSYVESIATGNEIVNTDDTVNTVVESTAEKAERRLSTKGLIATWVWTAVVGWAWVSMAVNTPDVPFELDSPSKAELILTVAQMKEMTSHVWKTETMRGLYKDGGFDINVLWTLQRSMWQCHQDLKNIENATELPQSCNTAISNLSSMLDWHVDNAISWLEAAQKLNPDSNTALTLTMIKEFKSLSKVSLKKFEATPEAHSAAKIAGWLGALLLLIHLWWWTARGNNRLKTYPSVGEKQEASRRLDDILNPLLNSVRNKIPKRDTRAGSFNYDNIVIDPAE